MAWVLDSLPAGSAFGGGTAAWMHGFGEQVAPTRIEVIVPPAAGVSSRAGIILRRARLAAADLTWRYGLRVTSSLRTCFDLAGRMTLVEAVASTDMALHLRKITLEDLRKYVLGQPGWAGVRQARRVIDLVEPAAESPMESRLRMVLVLGGLPRPRAQVCLYDESGRFLGRPDLYYPGVRLAIEYDGGTHRDRLTSDNRRQNLLQGAGIRLLRYSAPDVYERPGEIVREVREMLHP